ncbi:hypothetical protein [Rothia dentocariosa]|uniref:hypothetical protein n=1 Tax=Rothia dentocariosa TaxID=2047 RepID=UPI0006615A0E|nr:hypothetical protein [Rothia dentocariosa]
MTEPHRVIAGRRTADEWENSVGFFGIGKKKWEEQAKAAQAEAEAQADDVKSALPNSDAEASDRTLAERVNEQQRWENSLRRFVQAESTRMQQEEQKSKDTSDLNVDALKQSAQHSGSSAEPSASTAGEARTSGSAEGKKTVGASSQAANADAAQKGSFTQEAAHTSDASAPKRAPQISEYRATSMPADAFETNSSATAVPSSNAASVSGTASAQTEEGSQKQNVQDALKEFKEFNETKYSTEHEGNTSSVSSHADAAATPSSSAEKESADIKTPNVEDREREKLAAGVVSTDAEEKPAFVPAPGVESKNSNDKKTANADSKSTLEATPQESESASDVKTSAYEKKSPSPEVQATNGLESSGTPSASKKSDKIEFVGSGATGSAKHLDDRNDPETLAPEKNRSVETSAEKTSAEKVAVQHEKTVADEVSAHSSTDKDSKKQDVEKTARDEKASQNGAAAASSHAAASVEGNEKAEVLTPENPLHDLVTAMRGYGSGKVSYELRQLGDDMHYRIFHRGSEVEQGVVVPTDAWFSSIASLYVRAQDAGRVWNRALVVANPSENGLVAVQASYTNTADASSYTTDYILETSEKDSASQKDSSAKSAESAKSSADQSTASTEAADQKTSTAKTSALAGSADDTSSQKESEAKLAQDKSDEQAKTAESQKAKDLDNHTQNVKSADADKVDTQDSQKSEKSEHTVDSEKKLSGAHEKEQEVSAKAKADTAKSDSATAESTKSGSSALAAGTLGAAGVTAAGIAASSKSDREDSRYEYDYDADPQNVTGRHDAQAAEQSKTEIDSAKADAVSEKSAVSGASAAKDSSGLSTPEAEVEKTKVEKSSEDEEELNSMQAALATIVASSEAKKTASNAKEDAADTSAAVKTSGTGSKSAADKTSEDSQKAADSESTVKAESDAKTTAGYTSENQSANVTQAVVEESQAGTTSTDSSSALPKHVDDLALVPEVEKDSLTGSTDTKPQESASNKQDAPAAQTASAVAAQSGESTVNGKTAQHESADLPPAEAEPDTPAHQAHSSVLAGDALAEGNLVLTDAKVIEHLAPVTEALFGENGSAKDATTVLIRVRSVGSYYDVLTHVRRNGFWEQVRTFELVSEEDLSIPTLKADSYSEGEGSPLAMSLTFTPGVPVQSAFDYSNEQAFVRYPRQLEADRYVEELRMFPRLGAKIPAHMANALTHWSM